MIGYVANIEELTEESTNLRRVRYSGTKLQLVLMSLEPAAGSSTKLPDTTDLTSTDRSAAFRPLTVSTRVTGARAAISTVTGFGRTIQNWGQTKLASASPSSPAAPQTQSRRFVGGLGTTGRRAGTSDADTGSSRGGGLPFPGVCLFFSASKLAPSEGSLRTDEVRAPVRQ